MFIKLCGTKYQVEVESSRIKLLSTKYQVANIFIKLKFITLCGSLYFILTMPITVCHMTQLHLLNNLPFSFANVKAWQKW